MEAWRPGNGNELNYGSRNGEGGRAEVLLKTKSTGLDFDSNTNRT